MKNGKNQNKNGRKGKRAFSKTPLRGGALSNAHAPPVVRFSPMCFGFPDKLLTRLRYCDTLNMTCTSGAVGKEIFRWNSTYDIDVTNTGHQPLYRDTYASIYDQYAVVRATARFTIVNVNTGISVVCGHVTDDDTNISSQFNTLMEQNHGDHCILTPLAGSHSSHTFDTTWDCQEVLGIDPYASESYKTAVAADPTETSTLGIWAVPQDGSSTTTLQVIIEIIQEVLWTELTTPTIS